MATRRPSQWRWRWHNRLVNWVLWGWSNSTQRPRMCQTCEELASVFKSIEQNGHLTQQDSKHRTRHSIWSACWQQGTSNLSHDDNSALQNSRLELDGIATRTLTVTLPMNCPAAARTVTKNAICKTMGWILDVVNTSEVHRSDALIVESLVHPAWLGHRGRFSRTVLKIFIDTPTTNPLGLSFFF